VERKAKERKDLEKGTERVAKRDEIVIKSKSLVVRSLEEDEVGTERWLALVLFNHNATNAQILNDEFVGEILKKIIYVYKEQSRCIKLR